MYSVTAVAVLNSVNMCDVKLTQQHSRADGCTHFACYDTEYNIN